MSEGERWGPAYAGPSNWTTVYEPLLTPLKLAVPDIETHEYDYGWGFTIASRIAKKQLRVEQPYDDRHVSMRGVFFDAMGLPKKASIESIVREFAHAFHKEAMQWREP